MYDPLLAKLLIEIYGDSAYRYQRIDQRVAADRAHLAGFDHTRAARFVWPAIAPEATAAVELTLRRAALLHATPAHATPATTIMFTNDRATDVDVLWVGFDGHPLRYATVPPGRMHVQSTYEGHAWVVREGATDLGVVFAAASAGRVQIR